MAPVLGEPSQLLGETAPSWRKPAPNLAEMALVQVETNPNLFEPSFKIWAKPAQVGGSQREIVANKPKLG